MNKDVRVAYVSRRNESAMLALTSVQAFFIGTFFSLFYISSHLLFLKTFGIESFPMALVISGAMGLLLLSAYTFLSNRISFRNLIFLSFAVILLMNALAYFFYDELVRVSVFGVSLRMPFVFVFPLTMLALLASRRSIGKIYTSGQARRFYPVIQASLMTGIILSSFGLLGAMFLSLDILYIMAASAASMAFALLLQGIINLMHRFSGSFRPPQVRTNKLRSRFYEFLYTRYTFLLVLFILVSGMIGFVLHFFFMKESFANFPDINTLARFLGFFMGTMFLFIFLIERFLVRKILYTYDSPYSTILIPSILSIAFIASLLTYLLGGSAAGVSVFSFSFIMVGILRIGYETAYQSIELPSLRVLFRTLDLRFSGAIIPRMEGSLRMMSLLVAGLILTLLTVIKMKINLSLNILLLFLGLVWIPLTVMLIRSYQNALRETIRRLKTSKRKVVQELLSTDEKTHGLINSETYEKVVHVLHITEKLEPLQYEMHLISLLGSGSAEIRKFILEKIEENSLLFSLPHLKEIQQESSSSRQFTNQLNRLISRFENKISVGKSREAIEKLVNSENITDRILAAEIIGASGDASLAESLAVLSRDIEPDVKTASVKAMARMSHPDHAYILIGYLSSPAYYPYAFDALVRIGDPALPHLDSAFLLPDTDNTVLSRIVRIYGKIGTTAAIDLLLGKLENQNRTIVHQALLALRESKFQATPGNINRILNDLVRLINIMSWNFAAYSSLGNSRRFDLLREALESEIQENYHSLYHLLALAYNPTSISNIKNLLTEGNDTDISFGIELLDQIVHEEIKQVFLPVVENIPYRERFRQLQYFFHAQKLEPAELINEILTRDFNSLSLYAKACAMFNMLSMQKQKVGQELIACLFHPDRLMRESAAYVIDKLQPDQLEDIFSRLDAQVVSETRLTLSISGNGFPNLLLQRVRFLRECSDFDGIPEEVLVEVAKELDLNTLSKDDEFLIKRNDVHYAFMIIFDGRAEIRISEEKVLTFTKKDIIYSDVLIEENTYSLKATTDLKFYSLDQELLNALMFDHIEFRNAALGLVEKI